MEYKASSGGALGGKEKDPLGGNTQRQISLRESIFGPEEEEDDDLKRRNGFNLFSYPIFLLLFIFFGCFSILHELIPFSRVLYVV